MKLTKQEHNGMICLIENEIESDLDVISNLENEDYLTNKEKKAEWDFWLGEVVMLQNLLKRLKNE